MRRQLITGLLMTAVLIVLLGLVYPLVTTGAAELVFGHRANGSLVKKGDVVIGSSLIGQQFADGSGNPDPRYFQPRPSAAGNGYDAMASGGSNLGPSNQKLLDAVSQRATAYRTLNGLAPNQQLPVDAVTASASGLDPDISVANARLQTARVAKTRGLNVDQIMNLVDSHTNKRPLGVLGEETVNVLDLNLALDKLG